MFKKALSIILALAMVFSQTAIPALAAEGVLEKAETKTEIN